MKMIPHVIEAIYKPAFYATQKDAKISQAFSYFFKLLVLVSFITVIFASVGIIKLGRIASTEMPQKIASYYPADLQVTIKDGKASSNVNEPYKIPFPKELLGDQSDKSATLENLIVIDTTHQSSPESFVSMKTYALLSKEYLITLEKDNKISMQSLSGIKDATVNKKLVDDFAAKVSPYLKLVIPLGIIGVFVVSYIVYTISSLFLLLIVSLIAWIISLIRKQGISYGTWYKLGLYAITASIALDLVLSGAGLHTPWYINILVVLVVLFANVKKGSHA